MITARKARRHVSSEAIARRRRPPRQHLLCADIVVTSDVRQPPEAGAITNTHEFQRSASSPRGDVFTAAVVDSRGRRVPPPRSRSIAKRFARALEEASSEWGADPPTSAPSFTPPLAQVPSSKTRRAAKPEAGSDAAPKTTTPDSSPHLVRVSPCGRAHDSPLNAWRWRRCRRGTSACRRA